MLSKALPLHPSVLRECLTFMRDGDEFTVMRLDGLARSVRDLSQIADKKVHLVVLDQLIDTGSPTGRLLFHVRGAIGELERTAVGIAHATASGISAALSMSRRNVVRIVVLCPAGSGQERRRCHVRATSLDPLQTRRNHGHS